MSAIEETVAVVPVFNPDSNFHHRVERLLAQVSSVVVVDDGSDAESSWARGLEGIGPVTIIRQENRGIAAALNVGINAVLSTSPQVRFVLTVDQDSDLGDSYVESAVRLFDKANAAGVATGAICAEQFNDWKVTTRRQIRGFPATLEVAQSGMVIPVSSFAKFGRFNEPLFIDCVDTEFVLRMQRVGYSVLVGAGCHMTHEVGRTIEVRVLGKPVKIRGENLKFSYHPALRRYYISRNRVELYRKYFWVDPVWNTREIIVESRTMLLSVLFGPDKRKQSLAFILGIVDGARGAFGKAPESRRQALDVRSPWLEGET